MADKGFTLIELVVVIVILGVLAITAAPSFIDISKDAKKASLLQVQMSVEAANTLLFYKSKLPSYSSTQVRVDFTDIDMNNDGLFTPEDLDSGDVRLKWNYLDNTDLTKRIDISSEFSIEYQGIAFTYIGYDENQDSVVSDDNCYFKYTQASDANTPPIYEVISDGC